MKEGIAIVVAAATLLIAHPASSHLLLFVEVVEPQADAVVDGPNVPVTLRAMGTPPAEAAAVEVLLDGLFVDPASGEVSERRPAFGGLSLEVGDTERFIIKGVSAGRHTIELIVPSHHGDTRIERIFFVGRRPLWGIPIGVALGAVAVLGAVALALLNRRKA